MKFKSLILMGTLVSLIGCSVPRGNHSYRGAGVRGHQENKRVDHRVSTRDGVRKRMGEAVKSGKLTKEEAKERFSEWREKEDSGNNDKNHFKKEKRDGTKSKCTKNRQQ